MDGTVIVLKLERMAFLLSVIVHSLDEMVLAASCLSYHVTNMPQISRDTRQPRAPCPVYIA
jgi:hypothetical protein